MPEDSWLHELLEVLAYWPPLALLGLLSLWVATGRTHWFLRASAVAMAAAALFPTQAYPGIWFVLLQCGSVLAAVAVGRQIAAPQGSSRVQGEGGAVGRWIGAAWSPAVLVASTVLAVCLCAGLWNACFPNGAAQRAAATLQPRVPLLIGSVGLTLLLALLLLGWIAACTRWIARAWRAMGWRWEPKRFRVADLLLLTTVCSGLLTIMLHSLRRPWNWEGGWAEFYFGTWLLLSTCTTLVAGWHARSGRWWIGMWIYPLLGAALSYGLHYVQIFTGEWLPGARSGLPGLGRMAGRPRPLVRGRPGDPARRARYERRIAHTSAQAMAVKTTFCAVVCRCRGTCLPAGGHANSRRQAAACVRDAVGAGAGRRRIVAD